ncbi:transglutaminase-like cysteine peptidase [Palleronia sp. KMU-117]|uniref:transglutaminase-like cysteine peptidase n=1 Tax=Palleronia sp. KMU-117 TaxID=3434108 RepID=UPI003D764ECD
MARVEAPPSQYVEFCAREAEACALAGAPLIEWTGAIGWLLDGVNRAVNAEVALVPDWDSIGREELWSFPVHGAGDCEDLALEKRRRLVGAGLPGAALTCAIVFHQVQFFPHAILLAETTTGTWVLDSHYDEVLCWDAVPYIYRLRERPDGQWTRFALP